MRDVAFSADIESGKFAEVLIGFENMDDTEYLIMTLEASFRFPQDFEQVLQNVRVALCVHNQRATHTILMTTASCAWAVFDVQVRCAGQAGRAGLPLVPLVHSAGL